jgi:hypothetical protein
MKTMLFAAVTALSLGMGSAAFAESEGAANAGNTQFTEIPGVVAQAPVQAPTAATAQSGQQQLPVYGTSSSHGTWLFPPNPYGGVNG